MKKSICAILILFFAVVFSSCGGEKQEGIPKGIIAEKEMITVLAEMHIAEANIQTNNLAANDTTKKVAYGYYRFIFDKHKISEADFKKSFDYYTSHPEIMSEMYKNVVTEISKKQSLEKGK